MTLFESDSRYREKAVIWRVFSTIMLFGPLAGGSVFRCFAVNIPMDLGTGAGSRFTSDIDILARLSHHPPSKGWFYRAFEVKVSLICKDGSVRSLKRGKIGKTLNQLRVYRDFGCPEVWLLDVYLCESGFFRRSEPFPPPEVLHVISSKISELRKEGFGYKVLPFGHEGDGDMDVGLINLRPTNSVFPQHFSMLPPEVDSPRQPFSRLAEHLSDFFERAPDRSGKSFNQVVFCKACRSLQLVRMRDDYRCPKCNSNLIDQQEGDLSISWERPIVSFVSERAEEPARHSL